VPRASHSIVVGCQNENQTHRSVPRQCTRNLDRSKNWHRSRLPYVIPRTSRRAFNRSKPRSLSATEDREWFACKILSRQVTKTGGLMTDTTETRNRTPDATPQPMLDGFRNGQTDRRMGTRNDYSFYSFASESVYSRQYKYGYRQRLCGQFCSGLDGKCVRWFGRLHHVGRRNERSEDRVSRD
jgi:hypothetical protein